MLPKYDLRSGNESRRRREGAGCQKTNLPGNKEKCFFLTSPFIEPTAFWMPARSKARATPPGKPEGAAEGRSGAYGESAVRISLRAFTRNTRLTRERNCFRLFENARPSLRGSN